jgi:hypothetical protein
VGGFTYGKRKQNKIYEKKTDSYVCKVIDTYGNWSSFFKKLFIVEKIKYSRYSQSYYLCFILYLYKVLYKSIFMLCRQKVHSYAASEKKVFKANTFNIIVLLCVVSGLSVLNLNQSSTRSIRIWFILSWHIKIILLQKSVSLHFGRKLLKQIRNPVDQNHRKSWWFYISTVMHQYKRVQCSLQTW